MSSSNISIFPLILLFVLTIHIKTTNSLLLEKSLQQKTIIIISNQNSFFQRSLEQNEESIFRRGGGGSKGGSSSSTSKGSSSSVYIGGSTNNHPGSSRNGLKNPTLFYIIGGIIAGLALTATIIAIICCCIRNKKNKESPLSQSAKENRLKIKAGILECPNNHPINRKVMSYSELTHIPVYSGGSYIICDSCDNKKKIKKKFFRCQFTCEYDICKKCYKESKRIQNGGEEFDSSSSSDNEAHSKRHSQFSGNETLSEINHDKEGYLHKKNQNQNINTQNNNLQTQGNVQLSNHYRPELRSEDIPLRQQETFHPQNPIGQSNLHYVYNAGDFGAWKENPHLMNMQPRQNAPPTPSGPNQQVNWNQNHQQNGFQDQLYNPNQQNNQINPNHQNYYPQNGNQFGN